MRWFIILTLVISVGISCADLTTLELKTTKTVVTVSKPIPKLSALTACIWVKINEAGHNAAFVSYAVPGHDNEFLIHYYGIGFYLFIGNKLVAVTSPPLDDDAWHHVCVTWASHDGSLKYYHNGIIYKAGTAYRTGYTMKSGGVMVLGQEQDAVGGRYDANQALVGSLTQFNMWSSVLDGDEIKSVAGDCSIAGDIFPWDISNLRIEGDVSQKTTDVCESQFANEVILELKTANTNTVVSKPIPEMVAVTACIWVKIDEDGQNGALVSYAVSGHDNEFLIYYLGVGYHLWIGNAKLIIKAAPINDGAWHHVCMTWSSSDGSWKYYHNGAVSNVGRDYQTNYILESSGFLVLGQEQDAVGGKYDKNQALVGSLTEFNMWERALADGEITDVVGDCSHFGDVFAWNIDHLVIEGDVSQRSEDMCLSHISDRTVLELKTDSTNVIVSKTIPELSAVSACIWVIINEDGHDAALVSYAVPEHHNEFLIHYLGVGFHVYIGHVLLVIPASPIDDRSWHHVCITWSSSDGSWKYYLDGVVNKAGSDHQAGYAIMGGGCLVLGQEQDIVGGRYDAKQALVGSLTQFNMWSTAMNDNEIATVTGSCSSGGDVFSWNIGDLYIEGDVSMNVEDVCLSHISDRTILKLTTARTNVVVSKLIPELSALTACIWVQIHETGHNAAFVSYASPQYDNEFLIHYYGVGFHVYVHGALLTIPIAPIDDSAWHHVCITWSSSDGGWKYYHNGVINKEGSGFQTGHAVVSGGFLVLGQEQDAVGGKYDTRQALVGSLTEFNLWSRSLTADEIAATAGDCSIGGDIFSWNIGDLFIAGDVLFEIENVCLSHISERTVVVLQTPNTNVIVSKLIPELSSLTACIWAKINEVGHNAALVSYAVSGHHNEFLIHYLGVGFHVYVSNVLLIIPAPPIDDGAWHHVCFTWSSGDGHWQYYHNGALTKSGRGFQTDKSVKSNGYLVLGQEQDAIGGGYDKNQALVGSFTHFNMWSRVLPEDVISELERKCSLRGDVFAWNIGHLYVEGDVSMQVETIC
ncbi:uncharacterized protein [Ptychodera flava]|uniref:uncharacterized protein n=1 Tax=Ptychodera flava TaxID=63121 RepID=UPI003969FF27